MTAVADLVAALLVVVPDAVWRDQAPTAQRAVYPRVTIDDAGGAAAIRGDAQTEAWRGLLTVHLWQRGDEDLGLLPQVVAAVESVGTVDGWTRVPDPNEKITHIAITARSRFTF